MLADDQKSQKTHPTAAEAVEEVKRMADIGFPIVATSLVGYLKKLMSVVCMGRLGSLEPAGGALAIGFTNITGWYEFMTILAGYLDNPRFTLATAGIVMQTTSPMYNLPTALSASVSTRVGNELEAGQAGKACLSTTVAIGLAMGSSMVGLLWTIVGKETWGRVVTSDSEVLELCMAVLPIIGVCELANCPHTTCCAILRGRARPGIGAGINLYSFYLPGLLGLWYGLSSDQITFVVSILVVVRHPDWEREALSAQDPG